MSLSPSPFLRHFLPTWLQEGNPESVDHHQICHSPNVNNNNNNNFLKSS